MAKTKTKKKQAVAVIKNPPQQNSVLAVIERAARDKTVDVTKMRELLEMQKGIMRDAAEAEFNLAMRDCQEKLEPVVRTVENKHTKSKFAKLEHIDKVARPIYTKCGFSLSYDSKPMPDGMVKIICFAAHTGGFTRPYELDGALDTVGSQGTANKTKLQGLGSTVSYLRRYLMCMIFNIILTDEDNDGNQIIEGQAAKPEDKFAARARAETPAKKPVIIDAEVAWDEQTVMISGKPQVVAEAGQKVTPGQAATYLMTVIGKRKHKQSRIDMINENLALVRALVSEGLGSRVSEFHALADKGE